MSTEGTDRRLHRYFDGDLPAEEREALSREIAADPVLQRKLEALGDVRTLVAASFEASSTTLSDDASASMWAAIEKATVAPVSASSVPQDAPRADAKKAAPRADDLAARRRRNAGIGIGVFALAAAAVIAFVGPGEPDPVAPIVAVVDPEPPIEVLDPPDALRTEVLAVDFGTNIGTIFAVEGTEGQRYAVVWLDDAVKIDEGAASPEGEEVPN